IGTIRHFVTSSTMRLCTLQHMTHHTWPVSSILRVLEPVRPFSLNLGLEGVAGHRYRSRSSLIYYLLLLCHL
ncbi:hypothetical protein COCCADRAFT_100617, partial [Bipolaris zeicola 26-R-13]